MADEIDRQLDRDQILEVANLKAIRDKAANTPKGSPGECRLCGEQSLRLVGGACAPCRDLHKLP